MIDALLLDGENRSTLAACRSLGSHGLRVAVVGPAGCISHSSQYCKQIIILSEDPKTYVAELKSSLRELSPNLFLPMSDRTIELVSKDERLYSLTPLPSLDSLQIVQKKEFFLKLCQELSLNVPLSQLVSSASEISEWKSYPAVLKTARAGDLVRKNKPLVRYFKNKTELENYLSAHPAEAPWILQEQIVGKGVGVFVLAKDGEILASFCHQRILDKPPSGGVSVLSKSIAREDAPLAEAEKLIKALDWTGVAMVEFKYDDQTNTPYVMEINPRFWGTLQLSVSCGVDFPWLIYLMNKGALNSKDGVKALENAKNYKVGRQLRWDLGTLDHFLIRLKNEKLAALKDIFLKNQLHFSLNQDTVHETISHNDLEPFWTELKNYFKSIFR